MVDKNLEPCPFCGGTARYNNTGSKDRTPDRFVECKICKTATYYFATKEAAAVSWNRRTETCELGRAIERLRALNLKERANVNQIIHKKSPQVYDIALGCTSIELHTAIDAVKAHND